MYKYFICCNLYIVKDRQPVFLGDLQFEGVDPLAEDEFDNGIWDISRVNGYKSYYKGGKTLSPSEPLSSIITYFDDNHDFIAEDKKYRDLIAEVSKTLEYKDDKKKGEDKKKSKWGKKSRKGPEKKEEKKKQDSDDSTPAVVTAPPLEYTEASILHKKALEDLPTLTTTNQALSRIQTPAVVDNVIGRQSIAPQDVWADSTKTKLYIIPLGGRVSSYEV